MSESTNVRPARRGWGCLIGTVIVLTVLVALLAGALTWYVTHPAQPAETSAQLEKGAAATPTPTWTPTVTPTATAPAPTAEVGSTAAASPALSGTFPFTGTFVVTVTVSPTGTLFIELPFTGAEDGDW